MKAMSSMVKANALPSLYLVSEHYMASFSTFHILYGHLDFHPSVSNHTDCDNRHAMLEDAGRIVGTDDKAIRGGQG